MKYCKAGDLSSVFGDIFTANYIGNLGKKSRAFLLPMQGVLLSSDPVSQFRFMNLLKTNDNDRTHKNYANTLA